MAHILQGYERQVIDAIIKHLDRSNIALLVHDCIVTYDKVDINWLSEIVKRETGLDLEFSEDTRYVEEGVHKFIEWIRSGKLVIKAYPSQNIHAKLYIMTFKEGAIDKGRAITGSSNFTKSGLEDNLEFNVELKNPGDYEFAQNKFNELWKDAVDVSEKYVETIE
jgi:hypothetical protein